MTTTKERRNYVLAIAIGIALIVLAFAMPKHAKADEACSTQTLQSALATIRSVSGVELFGVQGDDAAKFNAAVFAAFGKTADVPAALVLITKNTSGTIAGFSFDRTGCMIAGGTITSVYDDVLKASGIAPPQDLGSGSAIPDLKLPMKYIVPAMGGGYLLRT